MNVPGGLHHVAYVTWNVEETTRFYRDIMKMKYAGAIRNDFVPSTGEPDKHLHVFFEMGDGSYVAFFEIERVPREDGQSPVPRWARHLALRVGSEQELLEWKEHLESHGIDVTGPTDHGFCKSIYFFDPNGIRLELTTELRHLDERDAAEAAELLDRWTAMKAAGAVQVL